MRTELIAFGIIAVFLISISFVLVIPEDMKKIGLPDLGKAPELSGTQEWLNSAPLKISGLRGKVVMVDFWTYSCINCIRTLPYLREWHNKYSEKGLVIIGVHTPEFEFEKDIKNLKAAVEKHGLEYPIVQDNDYQTWRAYKNNYWPRKYLIDKDGRIRYDHIGEGGYEETEEAIQKLLGEKSPMASPKVIAEKPGPVGTPELYFGYSFALPRGQDVGNPEGLKPDKIVDYKLPDKLDSNKVYLEGKWKSNSDNLESQGEGKVFLSYFASKANIVLGSEEPIEIEVFLDGEFHQKIEVEKEDLYNVVSLESPGSHELEIRVGRPGLRAHAFTFG